MPILYIIIPCYNEEAVLPVTSMLFLEELKNLIAKGKVSSESKILFCNDGSKDSTWNIIKSLANQDSHFVGISQSRNRGHQNTVLAGLMEAKNFCDITVTIDCDGQDDIQAIEKMVDEYNKGNEIVYGCRNSRESDSFFKRFTAQSFYKLLNKMGVEVIYNHADFRLLSKRVLEEFANFKEVNLFLRGLIPLVGFQSSCVYYERKKRIAGESHYSLSKMISLAVNGITSLSIKPIRIITDIGFIISFLSFLATLYVFFAKVFNFGSSNDGWSSLVCIICLIGGIQILSLGIIGEYIGKIYLEVKGRPRYIISERTWN